MALFGPPNVEKMKTKKNVRGLIKALAYSKDAGISEGDGIFILGFPMGMVEPSRQYVICRSGVIARVRDALDGRSKDFLVDSLVFPGNSGGPVIIHPELTAIKGTKTIHKANLIGIVRSYIPYRTQRVIIKDITVICGHFPHVLFGKEKCLSGTGYLANFPDPEI